MTKRLIGATLILIVGIYFLTKKEVTTPASVVVSTPTPALPAITGPIPVPKVEHKQPERIPASTGYANVPSKDWEQKLVRSLKSQSGNSLKDVKVVKERSFVWNGYNSPLHVESVIVTLTNRQDEQSSFKALVDSQTGKVLETWDRSIFDPANVREGFRFKLDPRYSN